MNPEMLADADWFRDQAKAWRDWDGSTYPQTYRDGVAARLEVVAVWCEHSAKLATAEREGALA